MEPRTIRCTVCGLKHEDSSEASLLTCQACGNTYLAADGIYLSQKTQKEIDRLTNLRTRLDELKTYNDYNMIYHHAEDILTILPEDIMARYFYAYASYHLNQVKLFREFLKTPLENVSPAHVKEIILHMATYMDIREYDGIRNFTQTHNASLFKEIKHILEGRIEKEDQYTLLNSDIFICHNSTDIEITNQVVEALENDGYTCWVSERNLRPDDNDNYWRNIEEAIDHCQLFLVISSLAAMLSKDVQRELKYANKIQKQKLEYKIDDREHFTLFKHSFDGLKWIDASQQKMFNVLLTRVYELLNDNSDMNNFQKATEDNKLVNLQKNHNLKIKNNNYIETIEIDTLKNLRIRLSEVVEINDYNMIFTHAEDILKILPDDFLAQYFYAYSAYQLHQPKLLYDFFKQKQLHGSEDHIKQVVKHLANNADIKEYDNILSFVKTHVEASYKEAKEKLSSRINLEDSYAIVNRDIFICHRSTEEKIVIELVQKLEEEGYTCWYSERNLRPDDNENYWKNIEEAIDHCEVFLVVSSQSAMLSKDVQGEMFYANKKLKKKLEYKIDNSLHTTLFHFTFKGINSINASQQKMFNVLLTRVYELLNDNSDMNNFQKSH